MFKGTIWDSIWQLQLCQYYKNSREKLQTDLSVMKNVVPLKFVQQVGGFGGTQSSTRRVASDWSYMYWRISDTCVQISLLTYLPARLHGRRHSLKEAQGH